MKMCVLRIQQQYQHTFHYIWHNSTSFVKKQECKKMLISKHVSESKCISIHQFVHAFFILFDTTRKLFKILKITTTVCSPFSGCHFDQLNRKGNYSKRLVPTQTSTCKLLSQTHLRVNKYFFVLRNWGVFSLTVL